MRIYLAFDGVIAAYSPSNLADYDRAFVDDGSTIQSAFVRPDVRDAVERWAASGEVIWTSELAARRAAAIGLPASRHLPVLVGGSFDATVWPAVREHHDMHPVPGCVWIDDDLRAPDATRARIWAERVGVRTIIPLGDDGLSPSGIDRVDAASTATAPGA